MNLNRAAAVGATLAALAVGSCGDGGFGLGPAPVFDVVDGTSGSGNPHFFLFPPIVGATPPDGVNVPTLTPELRVTCTPGDALCPPGTDLVFPGVLGVNRYTAEWPTNWVVGASYRLTFSANGRELGFADYTTTLMNAQFLPVHFRIEDGALCHDYADPIPDCGMTTLPPDGGAVPGDHIAIGALPGFRAVATTFLMTRLSDLPCLPTEYAQFEGCFQITVIPPLAAGEQFAENTVWVEFCLDQRVRKDYVEKYKSVDKPWPVGAAIEELHYWNVEDGPEPLLPDGSSPDCSDFVATVPPDGDLVAQVLHRLKRVARAPLAFVFGSDLMADDMVRHVSIRDASRFGWVRLLEVAPQSQPLARLGRPFDLQVEVRYRASQRARDAGLGWHHGDPVSNLPASFRLAPEHGGGALCAAAGTDTHGVATCSHTFPALGEFMIIPTVDGRDYAAFAVRVVDWNSVFQAPLGATTPAKSPQHSTAAGHLRIRCAGGGCAAPEQHVPFTAADYRGNGYQVNWQVAGVSPGDVLTFDIVLAGGGAPLGGPPVIVTAGAPGYNVGSTLPIRFRIE